MKKDEKNEVLESKQEQAPLETAELSDDALDAVSGGEENINPPRITNQGLNIKVRINSR